MISEHKELNYKWYIVTCPNGAEENGLKKVKEYLIKFNKEYLINDILIPYNKKSTFKRSKGNMINYIFMQIAFEDMVLKAFKESKIMTMMLDKGEYKIIEDVEIENMKEKLNREAEIINSDFKIGEEINVIQEPFTDFKGIIDMVNYEKKTVVVLIKVLGRQVRLDLSFDAIERIL